MAGQVRLMLPRGQIRICSNRKTLGRAWIGPRGEEFIRQYRRKMSCKILISLGILATLPCSLYVVWTGSECAAVISLCCSFVACFGQAFHLGIARIKVLKTVMYRFTTWFYWIVAVGIAINLSFCGKTPLTSASLSVSILAQCPGVLVDALPFRRETRRLIVLTATIFFASLIILAWMLWTGQTAGLYDYQHNIMGQRISALDLLFSTTFSLAIYSTQFLYRGYTSSNKLIFASGLAYYRMPMRKARFLASTKLSQVTDDDT